jgi:cobalt-zinc-cadmium efflux system membrane fusion protein
MKNLVSIALSIHLLIILGACRNSASDEGEADNKSDNGILFKVSKENFSDRGMRLDTIRLHAFPGVISANGVLEVPPNNRATINAFLGGYVTDVPLLIGDRVNRGQRLITLENLEFLELQQQYLETGERLKYLEAEYQRQKQLYEENINSQKVFLKAENEYEKIKIQRQALRKKLMMIHIDPDKIGSDNLVSRASIYAPIAGSVTEVFVNSGSYVNPQDPIMEVVNSDHMHLEIQIFEKDALKIEKGQRISFRVPEYSDKVFSAVVYLIGRSVDQNRTVKVHAHLEDEKKEKFIPGMFVQADIMAEKTLKPALPAEGFSKFDGKHHVLELIDENEDEFTFRKIEVTLGEAQNGFVEVDLPRASKNSKYLIGLKDSGFD